MFPCSVFYEPIVLSNIKDSIFKKQVYVNVITNLYG